MSRTGIPIGVASIRSGVKVPTIRYYEDIGLLRTAPRTKSKVAGNFGGKLAVLVNSVMTEIRVYAESERNPVHRA